MGDAVRAMMCTLHAAVLPTCVTATPASFVASVRRPRLLLQGLSSSSLATFYDSLAFHTNFMRLISDNQHKGCTDQPSTTIYQPCSHPPDPAAALA